MSRCRRTSLNASLRPRDVNEAPRYLSYLARPISCNRPNMFVTEAEEIESRSATSDVEAAPDPPISQMAFR